MAAPNRARPGRSLVVLAVILVGILAWALWPGGAKTPKLGLDLQGGTQVILVPQSVKEGEQISETQLQQTVAILRQRVDGVGVSEAEVSVQGSGANAAIVVSVPGVGQDRIIDLVGRTALLDFRPVWAILDSGPAPTASPSPTESPSGSASPSPSASPTPSDSGSPTPSPTTTPAPSPSPTPAKDLIQSKENTKEYQAQIEQLDCLDPTNYSGGRPDDPELWLGTCGRDGSGKYNLEPAFIKGTNVTGASASLQQSGLGWVVNLQFDSEGAKSLSEVSTRLAALPDCGTQGANPCNAFAIVLDGVVVSSPRFNEPIRGGQAQIEGNFTAQEAQDLANVLQYGALPVTLSVAEVTSVSSTIGGDQLRAGIIAGLLGLILVGLFLLVYYRFLGLVAVFSLALAGLVTYLVFVGLSNTIGLTLTLAGIAGAIIAIGITADSFIVYFERIRDEVRDGKTLRQATDTGWIRARRTILAADFVSLLAAVVLYWLSVGSVRGFAFVLGLTTLMDIIIAFLFTYPMVVLFGRSRWMQSGSKWTGVAASRFGVESLTGSRGRQAAATTAKEGS